MDRKQTDSNLRGRPLKVLRGRRPDFTSPLRLSDELRDELRLIAIDSAKWTSSEIAAYFAKEHSVLMKSDTISRYIHQIRSEQAGVSAIKLGGRGGIASHAPRVTISVSGPIDLVGDLLGRLGATLSREGVA
jgi:hypothetical protein